MRITLVDTFYWIALLNPKDEYHNKALEITQSLQNTQMVTTVDTLRSKDTEILNK